MDEGLELGLLSNFSYVFSLKRQIFPQAKYDRKFTLLLGLCSLKRDNYRSSENFTATKPGHDQFSLKRGNSRPNKGHFRLREANFSFF